MRPCLKQARNRTKGEMGVTSKYQLGSSWEEYLGTFVEVQSLQLARRFPGAVTSATAES